ncbi:ABC transporter ATP-binding protein [Paenibacillus marinisediminis]
MRQFKIEALSKRYGDQLSVNQVSFTIQQGRCTALIGPNGAGKTTTLNMIAGLLKPTSGAIRKLDAVGKAYDGDLRPYIGYLPQYPQFHGWMKGREWLEMMAGLSGVPAGEIKKRAADWLEQVGLSEAANRSISGYSGGMKQRLGLAQAMIHAPELLILDEPVSALDPFGRREVMQLLRRIKEKTTVLFSTHILHDAEELCDDLVILKNGKVVVQGEWNEIRKRGDSKVLNVEVQAVEAAMNWLKGLGSVQGVTSIMIEGASASLKVNDIDSARREILQRVAQDDIPLLRYEAGGLESFFMEAVTS